ncbi:aminotransferase class I/II-fold pyridoxal phosphate-dependent enzyme [Anaerosporobacter faecicola]|uniref:aminotransferase class I/II-fold pyridoxal phosphate-dependent enzyme n=1 Tax=Anaerosporobacter faecicola TaxID=2718714 RepID=UPI00143B3413|nr:aminotransferase class I/II-fold pyridoxal phosphate-dependent enzyme [Anaerosporobacter faecicola]
MEQGTFAERLKYAMDKQGMKQVDLIQLAVEKGVKLGKSHVSQYVSGKTVPRADMIRFLAEALHVEDKWLKGEQVSVGTEITRSGDAKQIIVESNNNKKIGGNKMREIKKSTKLDHVLYDVRGPVVDAATKMEETGTHILKLNIGNPAPFGFRTPDEVIYDMSRQLTDCEGYSSAKGLFSARKAIMQYAQIKQIPNVSVEDIYTGNGVSELINLSMSALLNDGDEILIPSPDYPLWTACATLAGGKPVHYICDEESEWYPDMADIKKKISDRTKAIVIINPNNPTGALYPKEVLQQIVDIAREHQLIIFSDEIYDRLVMDGEEHISIASLAPDLFCVTFSGLSKSHMIAGYRIGWMVLSGNKKIAKDYMEGINMLSNMRLCSNVPAQSIVQTALGGHQSVNDYIIPGGRIYEQREYIYKALNDIPGVSAVKPKAAFYIFPKLDIKKFNIMNDEKFALDLLTDKKILIIHGGGFNWSQPDHFRIVYLPRLEVLEKATGELADFLSYYRQ